MKGKHIMVGVVVVFVAVLAVIIGQRMSTDAMAVVIGVIFGVAASIPTSLLVAVVTRRAQGPGAEVGRGYQSQMQPQPPVIVVNPGGSQSAPWYSPYQSPALPSSLHGNPPRSFHVVGEGETALEAQWRSARRQSAVTHD